VPPRRLSIRAREVGAGEVGAGEIGEIRAREAKAGEVARKLCIKAPGAGKIRLREARTKKA